MKGMKEPRDRLRRKLSMLLSLCAALAVVVPAFRTQSHAAVPKLEQIRVALFIDNGKTFRTTVPTVTVSSAKGLDIGSRLPDGVHNWISTADASPVRASIDGYKVLLGETGDYSLAKSIVQALDGTEDKPYLFKTVKQGKAVYQVYAGMYPDSRTAGDAKERIVRSPSAAPLLKGFVPAVTGPLHLSAGTFAAEADARQQLASLQQNGVDAYLAVQEQGGKAVFSVWVGEAADPGQLNAVKQQAGKAIPGLTLQQADSSQPYLLVREDVTPDAPGVTASDGINHYLFNGSGSGQKVWIAGKGDRLQIEEKGKRQYRGSLELSQFNGKLAVINELPFEQYLVSVVGQEMSNKWPAEALKAQAVAARTFALKQGMKYQIAHISDSTSDQVYYGISGEGEAAANAVQATAGEVLLFNGSLIAPYFHSNAGGMTGDPYEVWGQAIEYAKPAPSPDEGAAQGRPDWYRVVVPSGEIGYIRSDLVKDTGQKTLLGLSILEATDSDVAVRPAPFVDNIKNPPVVKVGKGDRLIAIGKDVESNAYSWIRGPYTADKLQSVMNAALNTPIAGKLQTLEVSKRGPSGRVTELKANGQTLAVPKPDNYRNVLDGAPSTRFEIEETGRYTVLGANGTIRQFPEAQGTLYALSGNGDASSLKALQQNNLFLLDGNGKLRAATRDAQFRLIGQGYGHGLGMSQWGAKGLAEAGYDYKSILQYYYPGAQIAKD